MKVIEIGAGKTASFEEAFEQARKIGANEEITFRINGETALKQPISINETALPCKNRRIIFEGVNNACISGTITVKDFVRYKDNIFVAKVPDIAYTRNLYIDGKFAYRPSTEKRKSESWDILEGDYRFADSENPEKGIITSDKRPLSWKNIRDVEMVFDVGWTHHIIPIRSVGETENGEVKIIPLEIPYAASCTPAGVKTGACPNYYDNVFEELSQPLTWYFDRTEKNLYVCLESGDSPAQHTFEIPICEKLLHIAGTKENKIENIEFRNIRFAGTTYLRPNIYGFSNLQGEYTRKPSLFGMPERDIPYETDNGKIPAAVRLVAANNITFSNCEFVCLDNTALSMEYGTQNCRVVDCSFAELGAGAVTAGEIGTDRGHHPDDMREIIHHNIISNCEIKNTGKDFYSTAAIMLGYVNNFEVSHCEISNVPYTGISLGWGWGYRDVTVGPYRKTAWKTPTVCAQNRILYNHIHHHMSVLYDGGGIYTLGAMDGTVIRGNLIHNAGTYTGESFPVFNIVGYDTDKLGLPDAEPFTKICSPGGIYLDEGSRGIEVFDNILYDIPVPIHYHNRIDNGYTMVNVHDNGFGTKPGDAGFRNDIAMFAGKE